MAKNEKNELTPTINKDKNGVPIYRSKDGKLNMKLKRTDFIPLEMEKKRDENYKKMLSEWHKYKAAVHTQLSSDVLKEKTPLEKVDDQIARLLEKKKKLQAG